MSDQPKLHSLRCVCGKNNPVLVKKRFGGFDSLPRCEYCRMRLDSIWYIDMYGYRFGKLTVLNYLYTTQEPYLRVYFDCRCDCGEFCEVSSRRLRYLRARECENCHEKIVRAQYNKRHGIKK